MVELFQVWISEEGDLSNERIGSQIFTQEVFKLLLLLFFNLCKETCDWAKNGDDLIQNFLLFQRKLR